MSQPKKLCPLRSPFTMVDNSGISVVSEKRAEKMRVGFPCIGLGCQWWSKVNGLCEVELINLNLGVIISKLTEKK